MALVVPHFFIHKDILPKVIFSPGELAINLAEGLEAQGVAVTLFAPGPVSTTAKVVSPDLTLFQEELARRGDAYLDLLKKHPATFVAMARQVQSEVLAMAFAAANNDEFDVVHVYTNEEDLALPFSRLCTKPVVFTHHDPFNFLVKYKNNFPKYSKLHWISISHAQRASMPADTNWLGNVYHGLDQSLYTPLNRPDTQYIAYLGRIVKPKGVHLAIQAVKRYNRLRGTNFKLKIAGKHYADESNDTYWQDMIVPELSETIEYVGFLKSPKERKVFLANAGSLMVPSTFEEPFGMVAIEALACGTPVIALDSGALPEIISEKCGIVVQKDEDEEVTVERLVAALDRIGGTNRGICRREFLERFTLDRMCQDYAILYRKVVEQSNEATE